LKKKQDDYAKETQESNDDISRLKKAVNETKTESELQIQYKKREIEGRLLRLQRLNSIKETEMRDRIKQLKEEIEIEKVVKEKIEKFILKKSEVIAKLADQRDKLREKRLDDLD
jgi:hypothetical protein